MTSPLRNQRLDGCMGQTFEITMFQDNTLLSKDKPFAWFISHRSQGFVLEKSTTANEEAQQQGVWFHATHLCYTQ